MPRWIPRMACLGRADAENSHTNSLSNLWTMGNLDQARGCAGKGVVMADLLMHYSIPSENLPDLATVGCAKISIFAFRCGSCSADFHIDRKPEFCPKCGIKYAGEREFGAASR